MVEGRPGAVNQCESDDRGPSIDVHPFDRLKERLTKLIVIDSRELRNVVMRMFSDEARIGAFGDWRRMRVRPLKPV
jgi:hypothetical protein